MVSIEFSKSVWRGLGLTSALLSACTAPGAVVHTQRVHDPAGVGGDGVEIEPWGGGYMYLANHISPYLLPSNFNRRPVLVQTDASLVPLAAYTYMRPGENSVIPPTQLFLDSTDFYPTADGGFIICGNYFEGDEFSGGSFQEYGAFLLRIDGLTLLPAWFRQYPSAYPPAYVPDIRFHSVVETFEPNGDPMYVVAGQITTATLNQAMAAGFDSGGNVMWVNEISGFEGGYGSAREVIVHDSDSIAITGYVHGAPHATCTNIQAYSDALVARFRNDGAPVFLGVYGQTTGLVGSEPVSFMESGASLTRPTSSPDLVVVGNTKAWSTADECPGGPAFDHLLAFRIDPAGTVIWANRYGLSNGAVSGVQVKPITAFLAIAADTWSTINGTTSQNVGYFRLMSGSGALAQQTEIFGGIQADFAAGIIPLGPPYPFPAVIVGTSYSFGSSYPRPYLIRREVSAQRRCADAVVPTSVVPVPLPQHGSIITSPTIPMLTQPLTVLLEPITSRIACRARASNPAPPREPVIPPPAPLVDADDDGVGEPLNEGVEDVAGAEWATDQPTPCEPCEDDGG